VISVHFLGKNKEGDKDYLFAATLDEKMQLWNVAPQEGRNVIKRESPVGPVRHVEESGGDLFAVVGLDGRMTVVRRQDGMSIDVPPIGPVIGKAFFIGRHTVIALTYGNLINVWNCMTGERAVVEYEGEEIIDISLSANRELFARIVRRADGDGLGKLLVEHAPKFQWNGLVKD
jgi:WD40 repeat protein